MPAGRRATRGSFESAQTLQRVAVDRRNPIVSLTNHPMKLRLNWRRRKKKEKEIGSFTSRRNPLSSLTNQQAQNKFRMFITSRLPRFTDCRQGSVKTIRPGFSSRFPLNPRFFNNQIRDDRVWIQICTTWFVQLPYPTDYHSNLINKNSLNQIQLWNTKVDELFLLLLLSNQSKITKLKTRLFDCDVLLITIQLDWMIGASIKWKGLKKRTTYVFRFFRSVRHAAAQWSMIKRSWPITIHVNPRPHRMDPCCKWNGEKKKQESRWTATVD